MMYVLQVLTGRETEICGKLRRAEYQPTARRSAGRSAAAGAGRSSCTRCTHRTCLSRLMT